MTLTFSHGELLSWPVHMLKKVKGQFVWKLKWKQTNVLTDTTDRIIFPDNLVCKKMERSSVSPVCACYGCEVMLLCTRRRVARYTYATHYYCGHRHISDDKCLQLPLSMTARRTPDRCIKLHCYRSWYRIATPQSLNIVMLEIWSKYIGLHVTVSQTRSSAIAEWPRDASCQ